MHLLVLSLLQRCATLKKERRGWRFPLAHSARASILPASMAPILKTEDESATQLFVNLSGVVLRRKPTDENRTVFRWKLKLKTERLYEDLVPIDRRLDDAFYKINPWTEHWDLSTQIYQIAIYPLDSVIPSFFFLTYGFPIHRTPCFSLP